MITWVTVWVLTVGYWDSDYNKGGPSSYQLQYATQKACEKQRANHKAKYDSHGFTRCDFQQIPVVTK